MCEYCSCRQDEGPIAALSGDHERIAALVEDCRGRLRGGDATAARDIAASLVDLLAWHDAREERSFYAEMRAVPHVASLVERFAQEHRDITSTLRAFTAGDGDKCIVDRALDTLTQHIFEEEYDLFPASLLELGFDAWTRVGAALATTGAPAPA